MEAITLTIPSLASRARAVDLENALVGLSGVEGMLADVDKRTLVVTYDPGHLDPAYLIYDIRQAGYPVDVNH